VLADLAIIKALNRTENSDAVYNQNVVICDLRGTNTAVVIAVILTLTLTWFDSGGDKSRSQQA